MPFGRELNPLFRCSKETPKDPTNVRSEEVGSRYHLAGFSRPSYTFSEQVANGKRCPRNALEVPARSTPISCDGCVPAFFISLWRAGLAEYDEMEGIAWRWQSIDGAMVKAPLALEAVGRNPTDRGKKKGPSDIFWWTAVVSRCPSS